MGFMYAVIFRARIKAVDAVYTEMARRMRELALQKYGCLEFVSVMEEGSESRFRIGIQKNTSRYGNRTVNICWHSSLVDKSGMRLIRFR